MSTASSVVSRVIEPNYYGVGRPLWSTDLDILLFYIVITQKEGFKQVHMLHSMHDELEI